LDNLKKNSQKGHISSPSEVGQGMKTHGNGVENHAGNAINHVVFEVLQRWQNYTNIAPQFLVNGYTVDRCLGSRSETNNHERTTNNHDEELPRAN